MIDTSTYPSRDLKITVGLRSREGDFALDDSYLRMVFASTAGIGSLTSANQSTAGTTGFVPTPIVSSTHPAQIAFGHGASFSPATGGYVDVNETNYVQLNYGMVAGRRINTQFNMCYDFVTDFGSGPVHLSTCTGGNMNPCAEDENKTAYRADYGVFNIERPAASAAATPETKYPLFTQIAGKPFDMDLVLYLGAPFNVEGTLSQDAVFEVDFSRVTMPAADAESNTSIFVNRNTDAIIPNTSQFITLPAGDSRETFTTTANFALKRATMCVNYLVDVNNTIVIHTYDDPTANSDFERLYNTEADFNDSAGACAIDCASGGSGCYDCLKENFGERICARDDFAIRPAAFNMEIYDKNQNTSGAARFIQDNLNRPTLPIDLVAEYKYRLESNATLFGSDQAAPLYSKAFTKGDNLVIDFSSIDNNDTSASIYNLNNASCQDTNSSALALVYINGAVGGLENNQSAAIDFNGTNQLFHGNAGYYLLRITDSSFTRVDQEDDISNAYPDTPGCTSNSNMVNTLDINQNNGELNGCAFSSDHALSGGGNTYSDLNLTLWPNDFNLSNIRLIASPNETVDPNYVYMNDLNLTQCRKMGAKYDGSIMAHGAAGGLMTNYSRGCFGDIIDVNTTYDLNTSGTPVDTINFVYQATNEDNSSQPMSESNDTNFSVVHKGTIFDKGRGDINILFNIKKSYTTPACPARVEFHEMNASLAPSPTDNIHINAYLQNDFIPSGSRDINTNKLFYYARVIPSERLYDDVTERSIQTPLSVLIFNPNFCTPGFDINTTTNQNQIRSNGWWINTRHNSTQGEGNITLAQNAVLKQGTSSDWSINPLNIPLDGGQNQDITIDRGAAPTLPLRITADIDLSNSSCWLLYRGFDADGPEGDGNDNISAPALLPYFDVRFIGESSWTGKGNLGSVIDSAPNSKKIKRMAW